MRISNRPNELLADTGLDHYQKLHGSQTSNWQTISVSQAVISLTGSDSSQAYMVYSIVKIREPVSRRDPDQVPNTDLLTYRYEEEVVFPDLRSRFLLLHKNGLIQ